MKRSIAATALVVLLSGLLAVSAAAQPYPPPQPLLEFDVTVTTPGATIHVSGTNWGPDTQVEIVYKEGGGAPLSLTTAAVGPDGSFATAVTVPEGVRSDEITVSVSGADSEGEPQSASYVLAVNEVTPVAESRALVTPLNLLVVLFVAGLALGLITTVRRRKASV